MPPLSPVGWSSEVANLKLSLSVPNIPEVTQTLLNLAEFTEHCEEASVSEALTEWGLLLSGGSY